MKILHLTVTRVLYSGQRRQLEYEVEAARMNDLNWDTRALHTELPQNSFESRIPWFFRSRLLLRLYGWLVAVRNARRYDLILLRDMQLDVFGPVFGPFVRNRITVHHAKEIEELSILRGGGFGSRLAVFLEKHVKPRTMKTAFGLAAVTGEIRDYEVTRFPHLRGKSLTIPNGCVFTDTLAANDSREEGVTTFTFVCAEFSEWHGLDRLISALRDEASLIDNSLHIHLVGELNDSQLTEITEFDIENVQIFAHGVLSSDAIAELLSATDVAIGSLALDRKGLHEAATLKVREYLASGVPVYTTHADAALPEMFEFFMNDAAGVSLKNLLAFTESVAEFSRLEVREASRPYLDKQEILNRAIRELRDMVHSSR